MLVSPGQVNPPGAIFLNIKIDLNISLPWWGRLALGGCFNRPHQGMEILVAPFFFSLGGIVTLGMVDPTGDRLGPPGMDTFWGHSFAFCVWARVKIMCFCLFSNVYVVTCTHFFFLFVFLLALLNQRWIFGEVTDKC